MYIYAHTHTHTHIYIYTYTHLGTRANSGTSLCVCVNLCIYISIYIYIHTEYRYISIHIYIETRIHIYTHIYTQVQELTQALEHERRAHELVLAYAFSGASPHSTRDAANPLTQDVMTHSSTGGKEGGGNCGDGRGSCCENSNREDFRHGIREIVILLRIQSSYQNRPFLSLSFGCVSSKDVPRESDL